MKMAEYSELTETEIARAFVAAFRRTQIKIALAAATAYGLLIYLIFYSGLVTGVKIAAVAVFVIFGTIAWRAFSLKESTHHTMKLAAILQEDINPRKYLNVLNELERIYPSGWGRKFLWTEQGKAYYYLPDVKEAYAVLSKIDLGKRPQSDRVPVYAMLVLCSFKCGRDKEKELRVYLNLLASVRQEAKPNSDTYKLVDDFLRSFDIHKKSVSEWTEEDKAFLLRCIAAEKSRLPIVANHYHLARYEFEHKNEKAAGEHLEVVLKCEHPNVFLSQGKALQEKMAEAGKQQ